MPENFQCMICGAPATVHLTRIIDGKIYKMHLCEKCAASGKFSELPLLKFTEMLKKALAAGGKNPDEAVPVSKVDAAQKAKKTCAVCGMTDIEFEQRKLFGCAHCYETFAEEFNALLPRIQRGKEYCGNARKTSDESAEKSAGTAAPESAEKSAGTTAPDAAESVSHRIDELRRNLKLAVARENYALAARLRDELRATEAIASAAQKNPDAPEKKSPRSAPRKKRTTKNAAPDKSDGNTAANDDGNDGGNDKSDGNGNAKGSENLL